MEIAVLGIDLGKSNCSVVGLDRSGSVVLRQIVPPPPNALKLLARRPPVIDPIYQPEVWNYEESYKQDWNSKNFQLEPGEPTLVDTHFVVPCGIRVAEIVASLRNPDDDKLTWVASTMFDLTKHPVDTCSQSPGSTQQAPSKAHRDHR